MAGRAPDDEARKVVVDLDLTGETAVGLHVEGEVEHVTLKPIHLWEFLEPAVIDIDMARRAGAGAAAVTVDSGDRVALGPVHDRQAIGHIDVMTRAAVFDVGDFGQVEVTSRFAPVGTLKNDAGVTLIEIKSA